MILQWLLNKVQDPYGFKAIYKPGFKVPFQICLLTSLSLCPQVSTKYKHKPYAQVMHNCLQCSPNKLIETHAYSFITCMHFAANITVPPTLGWTIWGLSLLSWLNHIKTGKYFNTYLVNRDPHTKPLCFCFFCFPYPELRKVSMMTPSCQSWVNNTVVTFICRNQIGKR